MLALPAHTHNSWYITIIVGATIHTQHTISYTIIMEGEACGIIHNVQLYAALER